MFQGLVDETIVVVCPLTHIVIIIPTISELGPQDPNIWEEQTLT